MDPTILFAAQYLPQKRLIPTGEVTSIPERAFATSVFTTLLADMSGSSPRVPLQEPHIRRLFDHYWEAFEEKPIVSQQKAVQLLQEQLAVLFSQARFPEKIRVRLVLGPGFFEIILSRYENPFHEPIRLLPLPAIRKRPLLKLVGDRVSLEARKCASAQGYDEALLVDAQEIVREGAWTNFFWYEHDRLCTCQNNVLPGIVRGLILDAFPCQEADVSLEHVLNTAEESFVTQSTSGISAVSHIGSLALPKPHGERTKQIQRWYRALIHEGARQT